MTVDSNFLSRVCHQIHHSPSRIEALTAFYKHPTARPTILLRIRSALSTFKGVMIGSGGHMFDIKKDIQAMTTFRRNPTQFMKHLKKTKRPLILTINGKAEAVVQDAEAYQRLLDIAAQADEAEGIRQGLEDIKKGRVRPAREVLEEFRRSRAIPR